MGPGRIVPGEIIPPRVIPGRNPPTRIAGSRHCVRGHIGSRTTGHPILKSPDEPYMRELLEALHGLRERELRLEDDAPLEMRGEKTVPRDAELLRQIGPYVGDGSHVGQCTMRTIGPLLRFRGKRLHKQRPPYGKESASEQKRRFYAPFGEHPECEVYPHGETVHHHGV